jgi:hypothetical protein
MDQDILQWIAITMLAIGQLIQAFTGMAIRKMVDLTWDRITRLVHHNRL